MILGAAKRIKQLEIEKINLELHAIPQAQSHGLSQDEPLIYQEIIKDCFNNLRRKNFPDFMMKLGLQKMYTENESPDYWLGVLKHEVSEDFNN